MQNPSVQVVTFEDWLLKVTSCSTITFPPFFQMNCFELQQIFIPITNVAILGTTVKTETVAYFHAAWGYME